MKEDKDKYLTNLLQEKERIEDLKTNRESDVINRDRLARMKEDKDKYLTNLLKERKSVYEKKAQEHQVLVEEERKVRLERRKEERQEDRRKRRSGRGRSMRGSAPRWRRLRGRRWPMSARWRRGWRESAMSAETRVVEVEEEAGGMIAHLKVEEAAEEDGGTTALLQDEAHLQGGAHHPEEVILLQDVEVLLRRGHDCSWHQGLLEVQVEEVEVGGESVRSRRRNLGDLEAGTEIVPPGVTRLQEVDEEVDVVTLLQGEALLQEGVHLQDEAVLLAGMRGEAMQEDGDAEVEVEALPQDA